MTESTIWNLIYKKPASKVAIAVMLVMAMLLAGITPGSAAAKPNTTVVAVVKDSSVTISGINFPMDQTFTVRMGPYGSFGWGGAVVGTKEPSSSTSFTATYAIPASLAGASIIAYRFDSPQGYFAYGWFVNETTGVTATATAGSTATAGPTPTAGPTMTPNPVKPPYSGIPTIAIVGVAQGTSVSIMTNNFPANETFTVRMGEYGTLGIGGTVVGTLETGSGGSLPATYYIPADLAGRERVSIRLENPLGYTSYNWFYNNANYGTAWYTPTPAVTGTVASSTTETVSPTATAEAATTTTAEATISGTSTTTPTPGPVGTITVTSGITGTITPTPTVATTNSPAPIVTTSLNWPYIGIPTFGITSVVKDTSVTISAANFPPNQTFTVRMGEYGTLGVGGVEIDTYETVGGGSFTATYPIPAALAGQYRIAVRLESTAGYYYAFNWFYNN